MPETIRICPRCKFDFFSSHATYCSVACKQWAYRRRKQDSKLETVTRDMMPVEFMVEDMNMVRMIDADDVAAKLKCSRTHLTEVVSNDPTFPRPRRLGRLIRWPESAIDAWINGDGVNVQHAAPSSPAMMVAEPLA
ncbi:MAG: AlpA family phage regulatory protein [Pirellulales bacterium]